MCVASLGHQSARSRNAGPTPIPPCQVVHACMHYYPRTPNSRPVLKPPMPYKQPFFLLSRAWAHSKIQPLCAFGRSSPPVSMIRVFSACISMGFGCGVTCVAQNVVAPHTHRHLSARSMVLRCVTHCRRRGFSIVRWRGGAMRRLKIHWRWCVREPGTFFHDITEAQPRRAQGPTC
ncbi:hypothetical protein OG21DRAFT_1275516 [Imleria badia]|nr:hypothetical protein OG21DRAFT_1275516 [Imleria badia]